MRVLKGPLAAFLFVVAIAGVLLARGENTRERVVQVERKQVNACTDAHPRPCRALLNRLLRYADHKQKRKLYVAAKERAREIRSPDVQAVSPKREPEPQAGVNPPQRQPRKPRQPPERPTETTPTPSSTQTATVPEPLPPSPTVPVPQPPPLPPKVCETLPDLPLCR